MEQIDLVQYLDNCGDEYVDETHRRVKEVCDFYIELDYIGTNNFDTTLNVETMQTYEQQYLPIWRSRLLNMIYNNSSRRAIVVDSNDCISLVQLIVRDNMGHLMVFIRSCDAKNKLPYDVHTVTKFVGEIRQFYQLTECECTFHFGSLHYFMEDK